MGTARVLGPLGRRATAPLVAIGPLVVGRTTRRARQVSSEEVALTSRPTA